MIRSLRYPALVAVVCALATSPPALACSSCGCTLNSDWSSQYAAGEGLHLDLRYDYFNQNDLRSGTHSVDRASLPIPNEQEIQQETVNRNYTLLVDYSPSPDWGVYVQLPYFDRFHSTIAPGDTDVSTSHSKSIGDMRVVGRYAGFSPDHSVGVLFGLKLATGPFDYTFSDGPQAGEPLDRGLQPGTGTTDLLVGVYDYGAISRDWDFFAQAMLQQPLNSRDEFKPGTGLNANVGLRYMSLEHVVPQVQINVRAEKRESGANADVANSGATLVYLSPGVVAHFGNGFSGYAFFQVPIYQRVNGLQLEPKYSVSVGIGYSI
jgi:hypothetical protein